MTRYRFHATIGHGPHGPVRRATPERLGAVAVAVRDVPVPDGPARAQLRFDAERLALVGHPGLVLIDDITPVDDHVVRIASTLADESLADRLVLGPRSLTEAASIVDQVVDALAAAHRAGLVHHGLSDANIVFRHGRAMVCDLALSDLRRRSAGHDLATADESRTSSPADQHVDVIALATLASGWIDPADTSAPARHHRDICAAVIADPDLGLDHLRRARPRPTTAPVGPAVADAGPTSTPVRSSPTRRARIAAVVAGVGAVIVGATAGSIALAATDRPTARATAPTALATSGAECPAVRPVSDDQTIIGTADVDGDGCIEAIGWRQDEAIASWTDRHGTHHRVRVGVIGDVAVVGDWACDGTPTIGVYRPSTGETFLFDGWADADGDAVAVAGPTLPTEVAVTVVDDGCDRIGPA